MDQIEQNKKLIKQLEEDNQRLEAQQRVQTRIKELSKRPSIFPPGFDFFWYHRHDPFESYWRLQFTGEGKELCWDFDDCSDVEVKARECAWALFDEAVAICKAAELLK